MARDFDSEEEESEDEDEDEEEEEFDEEDKPTYGEHMQALCLANKLMKKKDKTIAQLEKEHEVAIFRVRQLEDEIKNLSTSHKSTHESYDKLKVDHIELKEKYEALEVVYQAIDLDKCNSSTPSSSTSITSYVTCDELTPSLDEKILNEYHKLKEECEMVMDGFERLTRGRTLHKEILGRNLINNAETKGTWFLPCLHQHHWQE